MIDSAKTQIKSMVNNVVFPVIDLILSVLFFAKIALRIWTTESMASSSSPRRQSCLPALFSHLLKRFIFGALYQCNTNRPCKAIWNFAGAIYLYDLLAYCRHYHSYLIVTFWKNNSEHTVWLFFRLNINHRNHLLCVKIVIHQMFIDRSSDSTPLNVTV